ncbi:MAG: hypothetical protein Ta2F_08880 [Termitinemataceae bacterium]|nr:MAG: hypothetical protein Ta2F_08880 [Termitinemataceae bacterium]
MKRAYSKPVIYYAKEPASIIPAVLGVGMALTSALGLAASSAAAVGGVALGAAAGAGLAGGVAAGTALAKKGRHHFDRWECLPALDAVGVC